jgi:hypothetical protein
MQAHRHPIASMLTCSNRMLFQVYFGGQRGRETSTETQVLQRTGAAVLHAGQHWHGARQLEDEGDQRMNLVVWGRGRGFRGSAAEVFAGRCLVGGAPPPLDETWGAAGGASLKA